MFNYKRYSGELGTWTGVTFSLDKFRWLKGSPWSSRKTINKIHCRPFERDFPSRKNTWQREVFEDKLMRLRARHCSNCKYRIMATETSSWLRCLQSNTFERRENV